MNKFKKIFLTIIITTTVCSTPNPILAASNVFGVDYGNDPGLVNNIGNGPDMFGMNYVAELGLSDGAEIDLRDGLVNIIRYLLTFVGIIAVGVIMLAGVKWMVSGGDTTKVAEARSMIFGSFIGIIIIMAAYSLTNFVINSMSGALAGGVYGI